MKKIKIEKVTVALYSNTTHVGITKIKMPGFLIRKVEDIIVQAIRQAQPHNTFRMPWSVHPLIMKALKKFDNRQGKDFIIMYYDHFPIGYIESSIPKCEVLCPKCKSTIERRDVYTMYKYPKLAKFVRFFLKSSFPVEVQESYWYCKEHGIVKPYNYVY